MSTPTLILASASKRRQQFLQALGLPFMVVAADLDETPLPDEHPGAMTFRLAEEKARTVARKLNGSAQECLIIASDTTVALDDQIYGKPVDAADATRMLVELRNRPHQVLSAVSLLALPSDRQSTRVNTTAVRMRNYSDAEIAAYVASGDPLDKAGAYAIQSKTFHPVAVMEGCYASVMGLPLADFGDLLAEFGIHLSTSVASVCSQFNPYACCAQHRAHVATIMLTE